MTGVGRNHAWTVVVAGQTSSASTQTTSFAAPQLLGISGAGSRYANTDGGQVVRISGLDFGPASATAGVVNDGLITVVYGPASSPALYVATNCTVSSASISASALQCITAPGIGADLYWSVTIGGQAAGTTVGPTSYGSPIVSSFDGAGSANAFTSGNQVVTIFGSNFGPLGTQVTATYTTSRTIASVVAPWSGAAADPNATVEFPATGCAVVEAHRRVNCTTTEGAGYGIVWVVTIGNQTSQSPVTNYRPPTITTLRMASVMVNGSLVAAVDPVGALATLATEGGEVVLVSGTDLGPAANRTLVNSVTFGAGPVVLAFVNCTFVVPHSQLACVTPPGVGSGYRAQVTVMYQSSGQSSEVLAYRPPAITAVVPSAIPTSGATVTLNGTSFGASPELISLQVNGVATPVNLVTLHRSLQFRIDAPSGTAAYAVTVTVGGQASAGVTVTVLPPVVDAVGVYDPFVLSPAAQAVDSCFLAVSDPSRDVVFQLQGRNLGDVPGLLSVSLRNDTFLGSCVSCYAQHTVARCVTTVTRGVTYNVTATLAGQTSPPLAYLFPLAVEAALPFVAAADTLSVNRSRLSTVGGDVVTIVGTNLGTNCSVVTAWVGQYPLVPVACNATTVEARTTPGAGVAGTVTITVGGVGGIVSAAAQSVFAYAVPVVTSVISAGPLPTLGFVSAGVPSNVTLTGSNFGPASATLLVVFVSANDRLVRTATNCTRDPVSHAWISCFGVTGVGRNHAWTVVVAGQTSNASTQTTSFAPPQLLGISGAGSRYANTDGGQLIFLSGSNFGPASATAGVVNDGLITVVYGPASNSASYTAVNCTVSSASISASALQCITAPGIGADLYWSVTVAGQAAASPAGPTSYGPPIVSAFDGPGSRNAVTAGGQTVTIYGSNFGPLGTVVSARYTTNKAVATPLVVLAGAGTAANGSEVVDFPATGCVVVEAHRRINCSTNEGAGDGIVWLLTIGNQTSQSPVTSYAPPTVTSLRVVSLFVAGVSVPSADPVGDLRRLSTEGGDVFAVNGTNFGPGDPRPLVDAVWYGGAGARFDLTNCSIAVPHVQLACRSAPGVGIDYHLQVSVMYQPSDPSVDALTYRAPTLLSVSPAVVDTTGGVVTLNGTDFGAATVTILAESNGVALSSAVTMVTPHRAVRVRLEEAVGVSTFSVRLVVAGQASNPLPVAVAPPELDSVDLFDPNTLAPAVKAVDPCFLLIADPAVDAVVQVQGRNFGASLAAVSVLLSLGASNFTCTPCFLQHTRARCVASVSWGLVYNLTVVVAGQRSNVRPYSYAAIVDSTPAVVASATVFPAAGTRRWRLLVLDLRSMVLVVVSCGSAVCELGYV